MSLSLESLKRALVLAEQIEKLEAELAALLGQSSTTISALPAKRRGRPPGKNAEAASVTRKKGKMSAAGRAAIVAAQKARWAKIKGESGSTPAAEPEKPIKKKRKISAAHRLAIVVAQKKRWAKVNAEKAKGK